MGRFSSKSWFESESHWFNTWKGYKCWSKLECYILDLLLHVTDRLSLGLSSLLTHYLPSPMHCTIRWSRPCLSPCLFQIHLAVVLGLWLLTPEGRMVRVCCTWLMHVLSVPPNLDVCDLFSLSLYFWVHVCVTHWQVPLYRANSQHNSWTVIFCLWWEYNRQYNHDDRFSAKWQLWKWHNLCWRKQKLSVHRYLQLLDNAKMEKFQKTLPSPYNRQNYPRTCTSKEHISISSSLLVCKKYRLVSTWGLRRQQTHLQPQDPLFVNQDPLIPIPGPRHGLNIRQCRPHVLSKHRPRQDHTLLHLDRLLVSIR